MNTFTAAIVQDVSEILIHDYKPVISNHIDLFKQKQKFMCTVFDKFLQTDRGKKHVREHERDFNAQITHEKWNLFYTKSTAARVNASDTLSCIKLTKIE